MTILTAKNPHTGHYEAVVVGNVARIENKEAFVRAAVRGQIADFEPSEQEKQQAVFARRHAQAACLYCGTPKEAEGKPVNVASRTIPVELQMPQGEYTFSYTCVCVPSATPEGSIAGLNGYKLQCGFVSDRSVKGDPEIHPEWCLFQTPRPTCQPLVLAGHCPKFSLSRPQPRERADLA